MRKDLNIPADLGNLRLVEKAIDELSMVAEEIWCILAQLKQQFGFTFIGFGDFKQLETSKSRTY